MLEQATHGHQHQADGAVAADPVFAAFGERCVNHIAVNGVEDDDGVVSHAQRRSSVDPVTVPACSAQFGVDLFGVVAALAGDDDVALLQCVNIVGVFECGFVFGLRWRFATGVGGGEEHGLDQVEIFFLHHAVHQNRADHAAPADQTY